MTREENQLYLAQQQAEAHSADLLLQIIVAAGTVSRVVVSGLFHLLSVESPRLALFTKFLTLQPTIVSALVCKEGRRSQ